MLGFDLRVPRKPTTTGTTHTTDSPERKSTGDDSA